MKKEDIPFLEQLINSLEEAELRLEEFYKIKDYENFDKTRKLIVQLQKKIYSFVE